VSLVVR